MHPPVVEIALVGVLGAVVGSFLNVVIHRLPRGESLVSPRSRCSACGEPVRARDNVPVLSWLWLGGRCRDCGASISPRYPAIEALTAVAFAAVAAVRGVDGGLLVELPFVAMLVAVAGIDLEHRIVPNRIVVPAAAWGLAAIAVVSPDALPAALAAGAAAFGLLFLAAIAYPAGMGMGDVKLAGVMGLFLGASVAPALLVGFAAGAGVGAFFLAREGAAARKKALPFAPFLALGGLVGVLAGPGLVQLYAERFLAG
jgi:leader peptidase (prepilin peptidase) / N-methyltransferase